MKTLATCLLSVCAAAGILSAAPVTFTANVLNAGTTRLADSRGDLVGPYTLRVNGINYAALCIDYSDAAQLGVNYSAYETQVGSSNLAYTYHPTFGTQYKQEAYLMSLIVEPNADRINIQDAAWAITDSSYKATTSAQKYITMAQNNYNTIDFSRFVIVSGTNPSDCNRPQEFLISTVGSATPEPASLVLMGVGLLAAGLVKRKKMNKV